jgi:hypothetical protein
MSEEQTTTGPESGFPGQAAKEPATDNLHGPSEQTGGQPVAETAEQTTEAAKPGPEQKTATEDTFFDPRELPPELMPAYKQMQAAFTKKNQAIKENRQKIEAYDAFYRDPVSQIQQMASQMGYKLTRAEAQQVADDQQQQQQQNWEPQTWEDVLAQAETRAEQRVLKRLEPILGKVQELQKTSIEQQMASIDENWQLYEDDMIKNLNAHPTLASDPGLLYRMSVPPEVLESRATQQALKKLQAKTESAKVAGGSTTTKKPEDTPSQKVTTFQEAVEFAKNKLAAEGMKPPAH